VFRRSEKYVVEGSMYAHWIGLYLSFHLNWVLDPFVHGRLQILQTSEVTFARVIAPLNQNGSFHLILQCFVRLQREGNYTAESTTAIMVSRPTRITR